MPALRATLALCIAALCAPLAAQAQTIEYRAFLGQRQVGTLTWSRSGDALSMATDMTNTPLGVGDGTFQATSRPARVADGTIVTQYISAGRTSRKSRDISVLFDGPRVIETVVTPTDERTGLSDPAAVPTGVIDPVNALTLLVESTSCPGPFAFYDGRRVVSVATVSSSQAGGQLTCDIDYRVTAGPGHLSPLRFTTIDVAAVYDPAGLVSLTLGAGGFEFSLLR